MNSPSIAELLEHIANSKASEVVDRNKPRHDPTRAIPILRDALAAWDNPCPFKRGDILMVARHSAVWKPTMGHVIVLRTHALEQEVLDDPGDLVKSYDMRVLAIHENGSILEFAVHSRDFVLVENAKDTP